MKDIKTAEIFYKEYYNEQWQPKDKFDKSTKKFDYYDINDFAQSYAEYYHKAKIESISDEEIEAGMMSIYGYDVKAVINAERDIKWFKNKLLNDL